LPLLRPFSGGNFASEAVVAVAKPKAKKHTAITQRFTRHAAESKPVSKYEIITLQNPICLIQKIRDQRGAQYIADTPGKQRFSVAFHKVPYEGVQDDSKQWLEKGRRHPLRSARAN
jgi:hypothetical protein